MVIYNQKAQLHTRYKEELPDGSQLSVIMKKTKLLIGIRSVKQFKKEALSTFKRAEAGLPGESPINRLYFTDSSSLFSALSPKRMELLKVLRHNGPLSIRKLASNVHRDYKNVYDDVKHLCKLELIQKKYDNQLYVPWDDITIELSLAA
jgi:Predicted transcriptional regulator